MNELIPAKVEWFEVENRWHKVYLRWLLQRLPFHHLQAGRLHLNVQGVRLHIEGKRAGTQADLTIVKPWRLAWLLKTQGEFGFVEAYGQGVIETPSLYDLLLLGKQNEALLLDLLPNQGWSYSRLLRQHRARHNSVGNAKRNIAAHYDLGNDFYRLWLDESMTYSSALFDTSSNSQHDLVPAQERKYQRLLDQLDLTPGAHILEIGCGWGGFAELAAKRGYRVTGLTLSVAQQAYAEQRLAKAGLSDQVEIVLQDYRLQTGQFDAIVSIEMFEAVGKEYWQDYFVQLQTLLKPGAKAALQIITIDEAYALDYQQQVDFIQAYIFPGGLLPSPTQVRSLAASHQLTLVDEFAFGADYAQTLLQWLQAFDQSKKKLLALGYDARFQRIWRYYLDYCRVGFDTEHISVYHFTLHKPL